MNDCIVLCSSACSWYFFVAAINPTAKGTHARAAALSEEARRPKSQKKKYEEIAMPRPEERGDKHVPKNWLRRSDRSMLLSLVLRDFETADKGQRKEPPRRPASMRHVVLIFPSAADPDVDNRNSSISENGME